MSFSSCFAMLMTCNKLCHIQVFKALHDKLMGIVNDNHKKLVLAIQDELQKAQDDIGRQREQQVGEAGRTRLRVQNVHPTVGKEKAVQTESERELGQEMADTPTWTGILPTR